MEILLYIAMAVGALIGLLALWILCICLSLALIKFNAWAARIERRITNGRRYS